VTFPLLLFLILGFLDLWAFAKQDLLATLGTAQGAQAASMGLKDNEIIDQVLATAQGALVKKNVNVSPPCGQRRLGAATTVVSDLYLVPLTALYEQFWAAIGRTTRPIHSSVTLTVLVDCRG